MPSLHEQPSLFILDYSSKHGYIIEELKRYLGIDGAINRAEQILKDFERQGKDVRAYWLCEEMWYDANANTTTARFVWRLQVAPGG